MTATYQTKTETTLERPGSLVKDGKYTTPTGAPWEIADPEPWAICFRRKIALKIAHELQHPKYDGCLTSGPHLLDDGTKTYRVYGARLVKEK